MKGMASTGEEGLVYVDRFQDSGEGRARKEQVTEVALMLDFTLDSRRYSSRSHSMPFWSLGSENTFYRQG